ncbi:uncharacterized protein [Nicotiana tomentosiformis]|uniref:uncharacterized protein n=1 Tax=Nicotiana tomentosiformis TaxID=4098 RepID=UPI00388CA434
MGWIGDVNIQHVPKKENKKADTLATLASSLTLPDQAQAEVVAYKEVKKENIAIVALKEVKKENVTSFIRVNIIYRFGIPYYIITDNGKPFDNRLMNKICDLFGFKQRNSSVYNVSANGLAEAFNKTLCNLLKKVVSKSKRDGMTVWKKLSIQEGITDEVNARLRLAELEPLDEKRLEAQQSIECYQARGSLHQKWDGPYVVQEANSSGAYKLVDTDGMRIFPINGKFSKKYYP